MMATEESGWDQGEELLNGRAAGAGAAKAAKGSPPQRMSMCGLLSIEFYQPYFNVDTSEVTARLLQAAWPLQRNRSSTFLGEGESSQRADLYGPVWVSATLIFLISVAANARREMADDGSAGEFTEVSTSAYSVLAYLAIGSAGLWAFFRAHNVPLASAEALSVYGYSLTPFLAAAPLCLFSWPFRSCGLATASLVAAIFVLRSSWPRLQEHMPEKSQGLLLAAVATYHVLWFLLLTVV